MLFILWAPRERKANIKAVVFIFIISLTAYIYAFASGEASDIKEGKGSHIEIKLVENDTVLKSTLLGTSANFLFAYDYENKQARIFYLESIESIAHVSNAYKKEDSLPQLKLDIEDSEQTKSPVSTDVDK